VLDFVSQGIVTGRLCVIDGVIFDFEVLIRGVEADDGDGSGVSHGEVLGDGRGVCEKPSGLDVD
jgi:hypothetical protein